MLTAAIGVHAGIDLSVKVKPLGAPFPAIAPLDDGKCDDCHRVEVELAAALREYVFQVLFCFIFHLAMPFLTPLILPKVLFFHTR